MPTTGSTTAGGNQRTYRFEIGPIEWDDRRMDAVVVGGFPLEDGLMAEVIVANRILAAHPDISAGPAITYQHYLLVARHNRTAGHDHPVLGRTGQPLAYPTVRKTGAAVVSSDAGAP